MTRTETEDFSNFTSPSASNSSGGRSGYSPGQSSVSTAAPRTLIMRGRDDEADPEEDSPAEGEEPEPGTQTRGGGSATEEAYSDADSNSTPGPTHPPNLADLILLDESRCRAPMRSKVPSGAKLACICGKLALECKRHADYRVTNDADRAEPGYYLKAMGVKGEHGMQGIRYPVALVDELRALQDHEINRAAQTLAMDSEEDPDDLRPTLGLSPRRVSFGAAGRGATRPTQHQQSGHPITVDLSQSPTPVTPKLWFGLEDAAGDKWVVPDLNMARDYESTGAFRLAKVFTDKAAAERWKNARGRTQVSENQVDGGSQGTSTGGNSSGDSSSNCRKPRARKPKASRHEGTKTHHHRRGRGPTSRGRKKHSDSESSSPGESSDSSTTSSSSSFSSERNRKKQGRRRRARRGGRRRRSPRGEEHRDPTRPPVPRFGEDKSTGDKDLIYGMSIHGTEIDAALGPEDMRRRDTDELYNAAMDVTSLPGMFGSVGGVQFSDDMQGATEMAATLLSTAIGRKAQIHDSLWKTQKRHALGQVKDVKSLFSFAKSVSDARRPATDQQEHALQVFLRTRRYDEEYTRDYVRTGFLVQLTTASFGFYSELLNTARQLAYDHNAKWEQGPAKAMLDFHAKKLLEIRMFALTRKMLVLRTYTYLRDASKQGFYDNRMNEALWRHALLASDPTDSGGDQKESPAAPEKANDPKQCSQCKSKRLHQLLRVKHQRSSCPFKDSTPREAKTLARRALNILDEEGDMEGGIQKAIKRALAG